jgi:hypothetical protein
VDPRGFKQQEEGRTYVGVYAEIEQGGSMQMGDVIEVLGPVI